MNWSPQRPLEKRAGYVFTPSQRVSNALKRLSRDKWLSGEDVYRISTALVRCTGSGNNSVTLKSCVPDGARLVGMVNGESAIPYWHHSFQDAAKRLHRLSIDKKIGAKPELFILQFMLKNEGYF